jgi:ATP/maltotriose-dependent transcriptional regulator MalT
MNEDIADLNLVFLNIRYQYPPASSSNINDELARLLRPLLKTHAGYLYSIADKELCIAFLGIQPALAALQTIQTQLRVALPEYIRLNLELNIQLELTIDSQQATITPIKFSAPLASQTTTPTSENREWLLDLLTSNSQPATPSHTASYDFLRLLFLAQYETCQNWLLEALEIASRQKDTTTQALSLALLALLKNQLNQTVLATQMLAQSLAICQDSSNTWLLQTVLAVQTALVKLSQTDSTIATEVYKRYQSTQDIVESNRRQVWFWHKIAKAACFQKDYKVAQLLFEKSRTLSLDNNDKPLELASLNFLADIALAQYDYVTAAALQTQAKFIKALLAGTATKTETHAHLSIPLLLGSIAYQLLLLGAYTNAKQVLTEAEAIASQLFGQKTALWSSLQMIAAALRLAHGEKAAARLIYRQVMVTAWRAADPYNVTLALWGLAHSEPTYSPRAKLLLCKAFSFSWLSGNKLGQVLCLQSLASINLQHGRNQKAVLLFSSAARLLSTTASSNSAPIFPFGIAKPADLLILQSRLGTRLFNQAWSKASNLVLPQVFKQAYTVGLKKEIDKAARQAEIAELKILDTPIAELSGREQEILGLVALGLTNPQIAQQLSMSTYTIGSYLRSIYNKLGVTSRTAAATFAFRAKYIESL